MSFRLTKVLLRCPASRTSNRNSHLPGAPQSALQSLTSVAPARVLLQLWGRWGLQTPAPTITTPRARAPVIVSHVELAAARALGAAADLSPDDYLRAKEKSSGLFASSTPAPCLGPTGFLALTGLKLTLALLDIQISASPPLPSQ